jgi:hypothetical protein
VGVAGHPGHGRCGLVISTSYVRDKCALDISYGAAPASVLALLALLNKLGIAGTDRAWGVLYLHALKVQGQHPFK